MIHQPLSPDGVHPQIRSSLRLLVLCLVGPECLFISQRTRFGYLDKCHTCVFNALITVVLGLLVGCIRA